MCWFINHTYLVLQELTLVDFCLTHIIKESWKSTRKMLMSAEFRDVVIFAFLNEVLIRL